MDSGSKSKNASEFFDFGRDDRPTFPVSIKVLDLLRISGHQMNLGKAIAFPSRTTDGAGHAGFIKVPGKRQLKVEKGTILL